MPQETRLSVGGILKSRSGVPSGDELFREWQVCPDHHWDFFCRKCESTPRGFRLLVNWLRDQPIGFIPKLPFPYRKLYESTAVPMPIRYPLTCKQIFPEQDSANRKRRRYSLEDINIRLETVARAMESRGFYKRDVLTVINRLKAEAIPRFAQKIEKDLDRLGLVSRIKCSRFFNCLVLAWCVRQAENGMAWQRSDFKKACLTSGLPRQGILNLTYLPIESLSMIPDIRASLNETRRRVSSSLMSYRQQQARGKDSVIVDSDGEQEEAPPSEEWELRWSSTFGMEKRSRTQSRQYLWSLIFTPLVTQLLGHVAGRKEKWKSDSPIVPDKAFKTASRLIHLRYPEHWRDNWQIVKNRYLYKQQR